MFENSEAALKQCTNCHQWFEKTTFPQRSGRCKECHLARARELSRTPEQVQKRKERRAKQTPEQKDVERERGRRKYAKRTPEQEQHEYERRQARKEIDNARARELRAAQSPERRERARGSLRNSMLKHNYGITAQMYEVMYQDQDGKCYFCGVEGPIRGRGRLAVDHNKEPDSVRGLLCRPCNANWVDEYKKLPEKYQDSKRTNDYWRRGETGEYIESVKQRLASDE